MNIPYKENPVGSPLRPSPPDILFFRLGAGRGGGGAFNCKLDSDWWCPEFTFRPLAFVSDLYPTTYRYPGLSGGRGAAGLVLILSVKGLTIYYIPTTKLQSGVSFRLSKKNNNKNKNNSKKKKLLINYLII